MFSRWLAEFAHCPAGASLAKLAAAEGALGIQFPPDYQEFLKEFDGGEGPVGDGYLKLWSVSELIERNERYKAREFYPGHVLIGSNGAGEAVAVRRVPGGGSELVLMPFIGGIEDALAGGATFREFLQRYASGSIWPRPTRPPTDAAV